jgi:hypothetical protein
MGQVWSANPKNNDEDACPFRTIQYMCLAHTEYAYGMAFPITILLFYSLRWPSYESTLDESQSNYI